MDLWSKNIKYSWITTKAEKIQKKEIKKGGTGNMADKYPIFKPDGAAGKVLMEWWCGIGGESEVAQDAEHKIDKGSRAELRRCGNLSEVIFVPKFHDLRLKLLKCDVKGRESLACIVGLLAHVKKHDPGKVDDDVHGLEQIIAGQMAEKKSESSESANVSGLRFRRLLKRKNYEEFLIDMRRIIHLLDNKVNIFSLAESVYGWVRNDNIKKQWAYAYYSKAPSAEK
jgi:CRISPR system Cascade subunit CasB